MNPPAAGAALDAHAALSYEKSVADFERKANRTANILDRAIIGFALDPGFYAICLAAIVVPLMLLSIYLSYQIRKEELRDRKKNKGKRKARKEAMKQAAAKDD